jgi:aspartokinase/homoserine dehydrogenase 1
LPVISDPQPAHRQPATLCSASPGALSGTLGYVMAGLQAGPPPSAQWCAEALPAAATPSRTRATTWAALDVARKALILARGHRLAACTWTTVQVRGLYPPAMEQPELCPSFWLQLPQLDADFRDRVEAAAADGKVLRLCRHH